MELRLHSLGEASGSWWWRVAEIKGVFESFPGLGKCYQVEEMVQNDLVACYPALLCTCQAWSCLPPRSFQLWQLETLLRGKIGLIGTGLCFIHLTSSAEYPCCCRKGAWVSALWKARYSLGHVLVLVLPKRSAHTGFWEALAPGNSSSSLSVSVNTFYQVPSPASECSFDVTSVLPSKTFLNGVLWSGKYNSSVLAFSPWRFHTSARWDSQSPRGSFCLPHEWDGWGPSVINEFMY